MSIVRVGLSETKNFAEGYDAIFGKKTEPQASQDEQPGTQEQHGQASQAATQQAPGAAPGQAQ